MKKTIMGLLLMTGLNAWGQEVETQQAELTRKERHVITNNTTQYDQADKRFGMLKELIPTQKLFNRLLLEDTLNSVVWNTDSIQKNRAYGATADHAYGMLYEMRLMSFDTSSVPGRMDVMYNVMDYMEEFKFEKNRYQYPIGIFDYKYNAMDENINLKNNNIIFQDSMYQLNNKHLELKERKAILVAPLFDLHGSQQMALVFRKENFYSNYRSPATVKSIFINYSGNRKELQFEEVFYFTPQDEKNQKFHIELNYEDGSSYNTFFTIRTPYLSLQNKKTVQSRSSDFTCFDSDEISQPTGVFGGRKLKLEWCLQPRCGWNGRVYKPFILITGYRPPFLGQDFGTTWEYYNDEHNNMLSDLRNNNYDVFIIRFNMHWRYERLGIIEASDLLEQFILWVNSQKGGQGSGQENVIQGSSMGASVARLTLLKMEKKHFEIPDYPNHHTRLNIAYDGNFYGANLPLSYQAQIYSAYSFPAFGIISGPNPLGARHFLSSYLFMTLNQKATTDLLTYHIAAHDPYIFSSSHENYVIYQPTHHPSRSDFLYTLTNVNNNYASTSAVPYTNFIPMPNAPRNIAISLGHNSQANHTSNPGKFKNAGKYWREMDFGLWEYRLGTAKYMSGYNTFKLFKRRKIGFFGIGSIDHEINVNQMREVDNASGSYLGGAGNLINVADWTYFFWLTFGEDLFTWTWEDRYRFSHKSVLTALAINENEWPANGSMTRNLKSMGLMYNSHENLINEIESNYFGYPNLGRPNDYFEVTPFEAIFCGPRIQRHIRVNEASPFYVDSLKQFVLNEVEPWYLGLQNMRIGSQARSNYRYYSFRRAKHRILVGESVTPTTAPGEYSVESNGKLSLHAGNEIILKPGVHFKAGAIVHIKAAYNQCSNPMMTTGSESNKTEQENQLTYAHEPMFANEREEVLDFMIYPNPAENTVTVKSNDGVVPENIIFYNLQGNKVLKNNPKQSVTTIDIENLKPGIYIIEITSEGRMFNKKLVVK